MKPRWETLDRAAKSLGRARAALYLSVRRGLYLVRRAPEPRQGSGRPHEIHIDVREALMRRRRADKIRQRLAALDEERERLRVELRSLRVPVAVDTKTQGA